VPEQLVWYLIVALAPIGLVFAFRRDTLVASLLLGYTLVAAVTVAVTSGNVGTLVRHRGLALPFMVCLSAVGVCELITWARRRRERTSATDPRSGTVLMRIEPTWR
jgi:FtsH-binding integral membrane protein